MSTEIIELDAEQGFTAQVFYGGLDRGKCLQINCAADEGTFVVLESRQFWTLVHAMLKYWFVLAS